MQVAKLAVDGGIEGSGRELNGGNGAQLGMAVMENEGREEMLTS